MTSVGGARYQERMITFAEAVTSAREYVEARWGATWGTPHVLNKGYQDDDDYLIVWGTREYLVDGDLHSLLFNNTSIFVSRRTGEIREETTTEMFDKIDKMTRVSTRSRGGK
jgi:hypothetical protein